MPPAIAAGVLLFAALTLRLMAPGRDAVCGPGAIECWDARSVTAKTIGLAAGSALAAAVLSAARPRFARVLASALVALAFVPFLFFALWSNPHNDCQGTACVPGSLFVALAGAVLGWTGGALAAVRRSGLAQIAGALVGLALVLAAFRLAGWP